MKKLFIIVSLIFVSCEALEIREPFENEIPQISNVYYQSWHDTFDTLTPYLSPLKTPENCLKICQDHFYCTNPVKILLVACQDNTIVGFIYAGKKRSHLWEFEDVKCQIHTLYVLPKFKGQGIGKTLLLASSEKIQAFGFNSIILESLASNISANAFYEKMGGILIHQYRFADKDTMNIYQFELTKKSAYVKHQDFTYKPLSELTSFPDF